MPRNKCQSFVRAEPIFHSKFCIKTHEHHTKLLCSWSGGVSAGNTGDAVRVWPMNFGGGYYGGGGGAGWWGLPVSKLVLQSTLAQSSTTALLLRDEHVHHTQHTQVVPPSTPPITPVVPLPGAAVLFVSALLALCALRWRRVRS